MEANDKPRNKMGYMNIPHLLFVMAAPMIVSMLVQAFYNVVDTYFVAKIDENAVAALSMAFPVQNLMIALSTGLAVGINSLLSKSLGEKNYKTANSAALNGILLALIGAAVFIIFGLFFTKAFFLAQTDDEIIISYGVKYLSICTVFCLGMFMQITFERLLQSTGHSFYTMISQGLGAIINIILDPLLIFGLSGFPKMGVAGAAAATVIGQIIAMFIALFFNLKINKEINFSLKGFKPEMKITGRILAVGIPSTIMAAIGSVLSFGINLILLKVLHSSTAVSVYGIFFKLQSFIFMPVFGLVNGMIPIIAFNYGARNRKRIQKTIILSTICAEIYMLFGLIVFQTVPSQLLSLFNASDEMLSIGVYALRIISLSFIIAGFDVIISAVFQALGNGVFSMIVSLTRQLIVILPCAYIFAVTLGINALWTAFPIAELVAAVLSAVLLINVFKKQLKPLDTMI